MIKNIFVLVILTLMALNSHAEPMVNGTPIELSHIGFNVGSLTESVGEVQVSSSGETRSFDFNPALGASFVFPMSSSFEIIPEINWVLPRKTGEDKVYKNLFMLRADLGYKLVDWLRLRIGTSVMFLNTHGSGGKVSRDNGNGQTTFYRPDSNSSSFNNTLDLGVEALWDVWAFRAQTYTYSLFNEERRQYSYMLMVTYYWNYKSNSK